MSRRKVGPGPAALAVTRRNFGTLLLSAGAGLGVEALPAAESTQGGKIDFFHPQNIFSVQTQRMAAEAGYGAADIFEMQAACQSLTPGDLAAWQRVWLSLADKAEADADAAAKQNHHATAITRYFHASSYLRHSDIYTKPGTPSRVDIFKRAQGSFRKAVALMPAQVKVVQVQCGKDTYDGYWCLPQGYRSGQKVPSVFFIGGTDSYAEEIYFSGRAMLQRGMAMLLVDTPGRGSAIYLQGIPSRYDYEVPVSAALDWMERQPEVDTKRMGLAGISMGGYYAPRAAAFEKRCKALLCWAGSMNILEDEYNYSPSGQASYQWITGSPDDATARAKLAKFDLAEVAGRITCPTMVVHGKHDTVMSVAGAEKLFAALKMSDKTLRIIDGQGAGHCNYGDWRTVVPMMFDWLHDKLTA